MKIGVIGAGAWGTALAVHCAQAHQVFLFVKDSDQAQRMRQDRLNFAYLPSVSLPPALEIVESQAGFAFSELDLCVIATPMQALRAVLGPLSHLSCPVVWACKGFEYPLRDEATGLLGHEVAQEVAPDLQTGVISGPSFALELAKGLPTAVVAASPLAEVRQCIKQAFHFGAMRVYENADWVGVEVGGAVKNVLAIATGICDGLALGHNARAALITRGLLEMTRLGMAMGADQKTFMGLSGLGDLILTATGDLSRNRKVGLLLAQGLPLSAILQQLGHVAEGVYSAQTVIRRAQSLGLEMPITRAVVEVCEAKMSPLQAMTELMSRQGTSE